MGKSLAMPNLFPWDGLSFRGKIIKCLWTVKQSSTRTEDKLVSPSLVKELGPQKINSPIKGKQPQHLIPQPNLQTLRRYTHQWGTQGRKALRKLSGEKNAFSNLRNSKTYVHKSLTRDLKFFMYMQIQPDVGLWGWDTSPWWCLLLLFFSVLDAKARMLF